MFIAIGLLAPQPRLIAISLWHQRKLPYWFTKVCYSHQLKPNLAYSPPGRLLRKRRDSVFRCGYDCTPLHPRPPLGGETRTSRYKPSSYYRLSSVSCTLGARRQDWVLGTMGFALHRDAKLFKVHDRISRNRNHQAYSAEGFYLGCLFILHIYYIINFLKNQIFFFMVNGVTCTPVAPPSGRPNTIQFWVRLTANPEQCVITPKVRRAHRTTL